MLSGRWFLIWQGSHPDRLKVFNDAYPEAVPVLPAVVTLKTTVGDDHAAASMASSYAHYPTRFSEEENPFVAQAPKSGTHAVLLQRTRPPQTATKTATNGKV